MGRPGLECSVTGEPSMRKFLIQLGEAVAMCLLASLWSVPANALAFAGVDFAGWHANFSGYYDPNTGEIGPVPNGINFDCPIGCGDSLGFSVISDHQGLVQKSQDVMDTFSVTNTVDNAFDGYLYYLGEVSAFNPGGSNIGASVTDPLHEWASFASFVSGPDFQDAHACDTRVPFSSSFWTPFFCGVNAPDSSSFGLFVPIPGPGETQSWSVETGLSVAAFSASEPLTVSLFGAGIVGAAAMRRRKASSRR